MKPALVLGLALAANAMVADSSDNNELFVAPTGKLAEFAKRHPGIMFDEQADDELTLKYVHLPHIPVPEVTAYDDDELSFGGLRPRMGNEDEFCGKYRYRFKTEQEYHKFCASVMDQYQQAENRNRGRWNDDELRAFDKAPGQITKLAADDDELAVKYVHLPHTPAPETAAYDDEELFLNRIRLLIGNDDEFCGRYQNRFKTEQECHKFIATAMDEYRKADVRASRLFKDDELAIKYVNLPHIPAPEVAAYDDDELFLGGILPRYGNDDEFCGRFKSRCKTEQEYKRLCASIIEQYKRADAAARRAWGDDELVAVKIPREKFPTEEALRRYQVSLSEEVAADELWRSDQPEHTVTIRLPKWQINPFTGSRCFATLILNVLRKEQQKRYPLFQFSVHVATKRATKTERVRVTDDEVTDDELLQLDKHSNTTLIFPGRFMHEDGEVIANELFGFGQSGNTTIKIPGRLIMEDDEVIANELFGSNQSGNTTIKIPGWTMHMDDDEIADEELALRTPRVFIDRNLIKPTKNQTIEARPRHLVKPAKNLTSETLVRDDEADDELLYLGKLIKDQIPMGTEGPKMKRKLRPATDNNPLA